MDIQQLVAYTISAFSVAVALTIGLINYFHNRQSLREQRVAERRKAIHAARTKFYGPLNAYLNVTKALYTMFFADKPKEFRTLTYLLDPEQTYDTESGPKKVVLSDSDKKILEEILDVERRIEELIIIEGGSVDDPELLFNYVPDPAHTDIDPNKIKGLGLLAVALTHFRVLRMAYMGALRGEVDRYKDFVYPRDLDKKIFDKIHALEAEFKTLSS